MRIATAAAVAAIAVLAAGDASGQTIGAAFGASRQEAGASDLPYLGPPFGGTAPALIALLDFPAGSHATLGGEASLAGAISGEQSQRASAATNAFTSHHRDSVFSGVFKVGTRRDGAIHAAAVVGGGLAYRRTSREGTTASLLPPAARSPYSAVVSDVVLAYSFGADVGVRLTTRFRVLAVARWHRLHDDDLDENGVVKRGVSSHVFRAGAGLTVDF